MAKHILSCSGIYEIKNLHNGKIYIGSAVNLRSRFNLHKTNLKAGKHHSIKLQRAWDKYGEGGFIFTVLAEINDKTLLIQEEQKWLDLKQPFGVFGYNTAKTAGSILGTKRSQETVDKLRIASSGRKHSDATKLKISNSKKGQKSFPRTPEYCAKVSAAKIGLKLTPEHRSKCGLAMKGKKHTEETKQKMSEAQRRIPEAVRLQMNEQNRLRVTDVMREKCRIASTGRKHTEESKKKMSLARTGSKLSPQTIAKRQATRQKNREEKLRLSA